MPNPVAFDLYLITDRHAVPDGDLVAAVARALEGGVRAVQLREKDLAEAEFLALARQLRALTSRHDAQLLINRRLDIALAVGADGLHLGPDAVAIAAARQAPRPARPARHLHPQPRRTGHRRGGRSRFRHLRSGLVHPLQGPLRRPGRPAGPGRRLRRH